jgi:hypothetical protein
MENKRTDIIVASYKEKLHWVKVLEEVLPKAKILPNLNFKIYRTGEIIESATQLPNKGLEAGQWLSHIVENYDNLADYNFFVQADLFASCGADSDLWPQDLNLIKNFRLPNERELGPVDDYCFYTWPRMERIRCSIGEVGMTEANVKGLGPNLKKEYTEKTVKLFWGDATPEMIVWPSTLGGAFQAAQHLITKKFIQRLPREYYENALHVTKKYELAHWLEFGKWPTIIYDIYRQGPLREYVVAKAKEKPEKTK